MTDPSFLKDALDLHSILAITDRNGIITEVNELFCDISGYKKSELIGKTHSLVSSGFHPPSFFRDLWKTILSGRVWKGLICNKSKNGELYWVETTIVPQKDHHQKPYQFYSLRTDVTELMNAREVLEMKNQQLTCLSLELNKKKEILKRKNIALTEFTKLLKSEKRLIEESLQKNLDAQLLPLIEEMILHLPASKKYLADMTKETFCQIMTRDFLPPQLRYKLSPNEYKISLLTRNGLTSKEVASTLNLSPRTIEKHLQNIRKKLGIANKKINLKSFLLQQEWQRKESNA